MKKTLLTLAILGGIGIFAIPALAATAIPWSIKNLTDYSFTPTPVNGVNKSVVVGTSTLPIDLLYNDLFRAEASSTSNDFVDIGVENPSTGICATSEFDALNGSSSLVTNFTALGMTGGSFTGSGCTNTPYTAFGANSSYLINPSNNINFVLATTTTKSFFQWLTGGYSSSAIKMVLTQIGNLGIGTTTPWKLLSVGTNNSGTFAISTSTGGCAQFSSLGELFSTGTNCGTGSGGVTAVTATLPLLSSGGTTPNISTLFSTTTNTGLAQGNVYVGSSGIFQTSASSSIFGYIPEQPLTFTFPLSRSTNTISNNYSTTTNTGLLQGFRYIGSGGIDQIAASSSLNLPNTALQNSSVTVNGTAIALGASGTVTANTTNALTFNNSGSGAVSGTTFNGATPQTISYNTIGAQVAGTYVTAVNGTANQITSSGGTSPTLSLPSLVIFPSNATSTLFSTTYGSTTNAFAGTFTLPSLATPAGSFLAVNTVGQVIATTTPTGSAALTGTTGQVAYFSGTNNAVGTSSIFILPSGNIGIGTTTPSDTLDIVGSKVNIINSIGGIQLAVTRYSNNANGNSIFQNKSRGTAITPLAVQSGDLIGQNMFSGYDGTVGSSLFTSAAAIMAVVSGTVSSGVVPANLTFSTANTAGTLTEAMRITNAGIIGIGSTTPWATLSVVGTSTAPVFAVSTSTSANVLPNFEIDSSGHLLTSGAPPVISACGINPSFVGKANDSDMTINIGSGVITSCTITFSASYPALSTVGCSLNQIGGTFATSIESSSTPTAVIISGGTITSDRYYLHCQAAQ